MDDKFREKFNDACRHIAVLNEETGQLRDAQKMYSKEFKDFKNNDFANLKKDFNIFARDLIKVATDVAWLKKSYWIIFTASVGTFLSMISGLIFMYIKLK